MKINISERDSIGITQKDINLKLCGTDCVYAHHVSVVYNKKTGHVSMLSPDMIQMRGNEQFETMLNESLQEVISIEKLGGK